MVLEPFAQRFPDRFFNVGVAEQNMVGVATGLAESGFIPYVYSIVTFASLRPYEFIRNGPVLHQLPVRVVAVGGGVEYGPAGPTHHGLEDIALMRVQPGLTVIAPADAAQAETALRGTWDLPGPVYYRLGKNDKLVIPSLEGRFQLGSLDRVREGGDLLMVAMGPVAAEAVVAADLLAQQGIRSTVAVVASVSPAPHAELRALLERFPAAITVEAHYITGGLGSLVAEIIAESGLQCRLTRCGFRRTPDGVTGSQEFLYAANGLSAEALARQAQQVLFQLVRS